jgi:hypothetical protein
VPVKILDRGIVHDAAYAPRHRGSGAFTNVIVLAGDRILCVDGHRRRLPSLPAMLSPDFDWTGDLPGELVLWRQKRRTSGRPPFSNHQRRRNRRT